MLIIYTIITFFLIIITNKIFNRKLNPFTIYYIIWYIAFFCHESGIIYYYDISKKTFIFIIITQLAVFCGSILGIMLSGLKLKIKGISSRSNEEKNKILKRFLIIFSLISLIGVLPNFINNIKLYGFNLISNSAKMYFSSITTTSDSHFGLSNFVFIVASLLGIYIINNKFDWVIILALIPIIFNTLSVGSRGTIFATIIFILSSFLTTEKKENTDDDKIRNKIKQSKKAIILIGSLLILIVSFKTIFRLKAKTTKSLSNNNMPAFLSSIIVYISSGIGCLDQYLKYPITVSYPQYFLRVPFLFTNIIGLTNVKTDDKVPTYLIPIKSNVITFIGELYHDFQLGLFVIIFILATLYSVFYIKAKKTGNIHNMIIFSSFSVIFFLSFFAYFGRFSFVWIPFVFGLTLALYIDFKKENNLGG